MKILLIEDEIPAARQLTKLLHTARPRAQVLETLDSVASAVRWLRTFSTPDLIFMDIQIADGLSFDIFRQIEVLSPVVFTTAFDQYAVQAFKVNAIDYLLKPIDPDDLEAALQKWEQRQPATATTPAVALDALLQHFQRPAHKDRFLVKSGQQLIFLADQDIAWFRSSEGLTQACTFTGKKYFVENTLEELDRLLNPREFFRVARGLTVSLRSIHKIHPHLNGRLKLELQPPNAEDTFVSRERVGEFKAWLGG